MEEENPGLPKQQHVPPPAPVPEPVKKSRLWKWAKRIFWTITIFILFILVSAGCILYFFGDKIKQYAIDQLNTHLNSQVFIDPKNIDFTVLQNFPNASVDFKEVKAMEATDKPKKEVLMKAGKISFQFNIMDIFHENYNIKKIELSDVELMLKVDKNGKDNFHILKESSDTSSGKFAFALKEFELSNVHVSYLDNRSKTDVMATVKSADLGGTFSSERYALSTEGKLFVDHWKSDSVNYLRQKNIALDLVMDVDNTTKTYTFSKGGMKVEDLFLEMSGNMVHHDKENLLNLSVKGKDMDIRSALSLVPAQYRERIQQYESEGNFYFNATVNGALSDKSVPVVRAGFGIREGEISQSGTSIKLKKVELTGKYFSGEEEQGGKKVKKSSLDIDNFSCMLGVGSISGSFRLDDLDDPFIAVRAKAGVGLAELQQFLKLDTVEQVSGDVKIDFEVSGKIVQVERPFVRNVLGIKKDFRVSESSGQMSISHVNAKLKNNPLELKDLEGSFDFKNSDLEVNAFSGTLGNSDFDMKGVFKNIVPYFFADGEDLAVNASLRSKNIDLNELLEDKSSTSKKDTSYRIVFPDHVDLNLATNIDKMEFRHFEAADISGGVKIRDRRMVADPITFRTMDGRITTSVMVDGTSENKLLITCDADLERLNLNKVFYEFENFGQDYLVDKNLRGTVTAHVQFASVWSPELVIDPDLVYALCDVSVERGRLVDFEPIIGIAKDIRKDKIDNLVINSDEFEKRLRDISFTNMSNQVEIKKQRISFTPMTIKSSAMNIDFSGHHDFNNTIEYHFNFPFAELPLRSEDKRKEKNKEFGQEEEEKDGIWLYYTILGTVDQPVYSHKRKNNETRKERMKEEKQKEKQNLKQILKDEFGWFKKDTSLANKKDPDKKDGSKKEDHKFILKWDDEEKKDKKKEEDEF